MVHAHKCMWLPKIAHSLLAQRKNLFLVPCVLFGWKLWGGNIKLATFCY